MYDLINKYAELVVTAAEDKGLIEDYEWLCLNPAHQDYQAKYRTFWVMGGAHLNARFYPVYFDLLNQTRNVQRPADAATQLATVMRQLYEASENDAGKRSIQFSFATKLLHTVDPHLPIYDSMVSEFYFFRGAIKEDTDERIEEFVSFYSFLIDEYARVIRRGLLARAIESFRGRCTPQHWTDEKIIDSLIWAFVPLLRNRSIDYA
jgi:hypothetical protein